MAEDFPSFINRHLPELIRKTSDVDSLYAYLLSKGVLSDFELEDIKEAGKGFKQATKLWEFLGKKDDATISVMIDCFKNTRCADTIASRLREYLEMKNIAKPLAQASGEADNPVQNDFEMKDVHIEDVVNILLENIDEREWKEVKDAWLNKPLRNAVGQQPSLKLDMRKSFEVWIQKTQKPERTFLTIVQLFRKDYPKIVDLLEAQMETLKMK